MIMHSNLSKINNNIFLTCLQGNYTERLREFSNTSNGVLGNERVNNQYVRVAMIRLQYISLISRVLGRYVELWTEFFPSFSEDP